METSPSNGRKPFKPTKTERTDIENQRIFEFRAKLESLKKNLQTAVALKREKESKGTT